MRKILVVEDEEMLRESYKMILSTEPYDLYIASNGKEALEMCKDNKFDLILLDLMMPLINGVDFLEKFGRGGNLPSKVIILSTLSSGAELNRALELGAYRNVLKSDLSPRQLISTVRLELEAV